MINNNSQIHIPMSADKIKHIRDFLVRQLNTLYGINDNDLFYIDKHLEEAIIRTLYCFSHIKNKYYQKDDINTLHTGQYMTFLYYLSNSIFANEIKGTDSYSDYNTPQRNICDKIYCLNKLMSSCEVYYEVELPDYFLVEHPVGSVIGRGTFGTGFVFFQGCTVGGNHSSYPVIGNNVFMYSNSKILGNCHIGNNVLIGANTYIKDTDIPDNVMVFGQYPNIIIKNDCVDSINKTITSQLYI